jgi:hypothetical protein
MKLRRYLIQHTHQERHDIFSVPRVEYDNLLGSLHYPVLWAYDEYLDAWLPSEITPREAKYITAKEEGQFPNPYQMKLLKGANLIPPSRRTVLELKQEMEQRGHVKIDQLFPTEYCNRLLYEYYFRFEHEWGRLKDLDGISRSSMGNTYLMRLLHQASQKLVNSIVPQEVKTSYSFSANYDHGSSLPMHTDRPQCVYNISVMLGSNPTEYDVKKWPLWIRRPEQDYAVELAPGDAVIYSGTMDPHWRDQMPDGLISCMGVFFHYVPIDFEGKLG